MGEQPLRIAVAQEDLQRGSLEPVTRFLRPLLADSEQVRVHSGRVTLDFSSIVEDDLDLHKRSEARRWFAKLDQTYPYFPYFLERNTDRQQVLIYVSLFVPFVVSKDDALTFDQRDLKRFLMDKALAIQHFCAPLELNPASVIREIGRDLYLELDPEEVKQAYEGLGSMKASAAAAHVEQPPVEPLERDEAGAALKELEREELEPLGPLAEQATPIKSKLLLKAFESAYSLPTVDGSGEPVLFILVDDPLGIQGAPLSLIFGLYTHPGYPVLGMDLVIHDDPDNPLRLSFAFDIQDPAHRGQLLSYQDLASLMTNVLFTTEKTHRLMWAYTLPVPLPAETKALLSDFMARAVDLHALIPEEYRSFDRAVNGMFDDLATGRYIIGGPMPDEGAQGEGAASVVSIETMESPTVEAMMAQEGFTTREEEWGIGSGSPEAGARSGVWRDEGGGRDLETEGSWSIGDGDDAPKAGADIENSGRKGEPRAADGEEELPDHIRKITRVLSKSMRAPKREAASLHQPVAAYKPPPPQIVETPDDLMERLCRKQLIMESRLEQQLHENGKLRNSLRLLQEEMNRIERDRFLAGKRWWRFWR